MGTVVFGSIAFGILCFRYYGIHSGVQKSNPLFKVKILIMENKTFDAATVLKDRVDMLTRFREWLAYKKQSLERSIFFDESCDRSFFYVDDLVEQEIVYTKKQFDNL